MLNAKNLSKVEEVKKRYPTSKATLLPVLWIAQEQYGWISEETMKEVADLLQLPVGHVLGVVSFYSMFHRKPVGKYYVQVCTNVSCQLRGAEKLLQHISGRCGAGLGETSSDKKYTLSEVECLGSCATAPMMMINDDYYENLSPEKVDQLLMRLK
jgi:NADH-quinone oxidoreductase E subunit